jgi:hypothetical protein
MPVCITYIPTYATPALRTLGAHAWCIAQACLRTKGSRRFELYPPVGCGWVWSTCIFVLIFHMPVPSGNIFFSRLLGSMLFRLLLRKLVSPHTHTPKDREGLILTHLWIAAFCLIFPVIRFQRCLGWYCASCFSTGRRIVKVCEMTPHIPKQWDY